MTRKPSPGFTLIELMVVVLIIGVLAAALLPRVLGSQKTAYKAADRLNLQWHYDLLLEYKRQRLRWPKGGGHKFVLAPWIKKIIEHTEENRDRYFIPGQGDDPRWQELRDEDPEDIWKSFDDVTSADTHYAGRAEQFYRGMWSGKQALMADDNEGVRSHADGTINVLMGSRSVRELLQVKQLKKYWEGEDGDEEYVFPVGPESPMPLLQKLAK